MVKFKMEPDSTNPGGNVMPIPGHSSIGAARTQGGGTKYSVSDGPKGKGSSGLGHNGKTSGPAGTRISGFHGAPKGYSCGTINVRGSSNPMKR